MEFPADRDPGIYPYLASLNDAQLRAVTAPPTTPLQILAGPGSGKTRVLTSRVAHLVKCHGYEPRTITAVTFTNKAAAEMRKRLVVLLGEREANQLVLGTFHATCAKYLRRYGSRIGLNNNFAITDADDCRKIMSRLLKDRREALTKAHIQLKEGGVLSEISKAKAKGESPEGMAIRAKKVQATAAVDSQFVPDVLGIIAELYTEYQAELQSSNALDFDDLLLYALKLFRADPTILASCRHILVDEFQDTNTTQYELMKRFADANGGVSIVGDPDQSIYGWRSAEVENLDYMTRDFKNSEAIYLEENYRSTGSILAASRSIVSQDPKRIKKDLYTSHPKSTPVTLKLFSTPVIEASFIATEIKRMVAYSGDMLNYDDFAILLRYNALSRVIESALQKESIPSRIIGGHKFFERMEVKDLLAYLQLADNPNFTPAFMRVVNVPRRKLGDKSLADIVSHAKKRGVSPMQFCKSIAAGEVPPAGFTAPTKRIKDFVNVIRDIRDAALRGEDVADLLDRIITKTQYKEYLADQCKTDFDQRWENVQELKSYSVIVAGEQGRQSPETELPPTEGFSSAKDVMQLLPEELRVKQSPQLHPMFRRQDLSTSSTRSNKSAPKNKKQPVKIDEDDVIELLSSEDEIEAFDAQPLGQASASPERDGVDGLNPLRFFLQSSMLSTDTESSDDNAQVPVTISTVHAAKGLEWPVVFIPAVEQGTFPAARSIEEKEVAEERRLLYVAMTRAQVFLTMSYCMSRMVGAETLDRNLSEFVDKSLRQEPTIFTSSLPIIDEVVRRQMAPMITRPLPDEEATKALIMRHVRAAPPLSTWDAPDQHHSRLSRRDGPGSMSRGFEYWACDVDDYDSPRPRASSSSSRPGFMAFSSAKSFVPPHAAPVIPKPPVPRVQSSNRNLPAPLPFTFNQPARPAASLTSFTSSSTSSLAAMKALGLPEATGASNKPRGPGGVSSSVSLLPANNSILGAAPARPGGREMGMGGQVTRQAAGASPASETLTGSAQGPSSSTTTIPLARGTKRLGMGRHVAPWGSKRGKAE